MSQERRLAEWIERHRPERGYFPEGQAGDEAFNTALLEYSKKLSTIMAKHGVSGRSLPSGLRFVNGQPSYEKWSSE